MIRLQIRYEDGSEQTLTLEVPAIIGRAPEADFRIRSWRIAKHHTRVIRRDAGIFLEDLGALAGTFVNDQRIAEYGPLMPSDEVVIGPCLLQIELADVAEATLTPPSYPNPTVNGLSNVADVTPVQATEKARLQERARLKQRLHQALRDALDLRRRDIGKLSDEALRLEAERLLKQILETAEALPDDVDEDALLQEVVDEAVGLGPLEPLLADPSVTEIMVNRHDEIFVERSGRLYPFSGGFSSEQAVLSVIDRIVAPLGRRIDDGAPMVDARLKDGSRVNAIIPPIALRGPSLTIRKFPMRRPLMQDLLAIGSLDEAMATFLEACVLLRKNMIVSGGTGSGKTTLLNILSNVIPDGERIITIEDAAELQLSHSHLIQLEARPANLEGRGAITIRDLVRNALRMRPDRIVVGECRGAEAFDMLAAMNTGHEGSLTTLHANSPRDALSRLETMILMAGMDLPLEAVREQVAASVEFIVQQARLSTGRRVITSITQVTGQESGRIQLQELFRFQAGPPASFQGTGLLPENFPQLERLPVDLFNRHTVVEKTAVNWSSGAPT